MATVYDEIGGAPAVSAAVGDFYGRVLADPALVHYFDGVDTDRLMAHQRSFIAAALGGPEVYAGRSMKEAHAHLGVTKDAFERVVGHLVAALQGLGVPEATVGAIGAKLAPLEGEIVAAQAA